MVAAVPAVWRGLAVPAGLSCRVRAVGTQAGSESQLHRDKADAGRGLIREAARRRAAALHGQLHLPRPENRKPGSSFEEPGYKPGNNLLSRDLTSNYHWLLGA